jgi:hypothetical protein
LRREGGARDVALIVTGEPLANGFKAQGNSQQDPDLTDIAGRAKACIERTDGGESDNESIERVGEEEPDKRVADKFQIENEEENRKESGEEGEPRKLAGGKQNDLTGNERPSVPGGVAG